MFVINYEQFQMISEVTATVRKRTGTAARSEYRPPHAAEVRTCTPHPHAPGTTSISPADGRPGSPPGPSPQPPTPQGDVARRLTGPHPRVAPTPPWEPPAPDVLAVKGNSTHTSGSGIPRRVCLPVLCTALTEPHLGWR